MQVGLVISPYYSMISQKPPLLGPTRRRYLSRIASMLRDMEFTLIPTCLESSDLEIYGFYIISLMIEIRFFVNFSLSAIAFSITFSVTLTSFSITLSVTFGTVIFKIKSSRWKYIFINRITGTYSCIFGIYSCIFIDSRLYK